MAERADHEATAAAAGQPSQAPSQPQNVKKEPLQTQQQQQQQTQAQSPAQAQSIRTHPLPDNASLDEMLKRNIPQAFSASSSTASYNITPEFMQQAENVVAMHLEKVQRNQSNAAGAGKSEIILLDSTERSRGYTKLREWVESGLEGWKVSRAVIFVVR
jgi:hypothetical protein